MSLSIGDRVGRYEILSLLGTGGMGEVYRARDAELERDVAIKVLRDATDESGNRIRRFVQEAKASSGLHHPNVAHVYEIGSHGDLRYIVMELVEGETLRRVVGRGPMPMDAILDVATQVAAALGAAHKAGIVHRDIKPENVIITPDGYAKVLDFGLAKLRELQGESSATVVMTAPGTALGTLAYMPPEQLVGGDVTPSADIFSLGVVLYEMVCGQRPFQGATNGDLASAILTKPPLPLHERRPDVSPKLEALISKALSKNAAERQTDATQLHEELRAISREASAVSVPVARGGKLKLAWIGVTIAVIVLVASGARWMVRSQRQKTALAKIEAAETLIGQKKLFDAYELAIAASPFLSNDPRVRQVIAQSAAPLTIETEPPGATAWLQRVALPSKRIRAGVTPLAIAEIARDDYLLTLEKPGYATATRPISTMPLYIHGDASPRPPTKVRMKLGEASKVPPGMVYVEGGTYRLGGFYRPSDRVVELRDFFIDRYEVTNREFELFIRAGGYRRRELWKQAFVEGAKSLTFEEAMARFRDTTGLPGPRSWSGGSPPAGRENHPVTDVTWYEAAAFAAWKGKKLPSVYQWEKAAKHADTSAAANAFPWGFVGEGVDATDRANFNGKGTLPVDTMPFGASPYGAHHMAGNVTEWCRNADAPGYAARGGSWQDAVYAFGQTAAFPPFYSAPTLGFRCVSGGGGDEGDFTLEPSGFVPVYEAVDDATFAKYRSRYEYKREPLHARVVETVETPDWKREKITYVVAGKTVPAYLYTPKGFRGPLQVIHFAPAGDVVSGWRTLPQSIEISLAPLIRGGRAVFSVELEGFLGRPAPPGWVVPDRRLDEYVDAYVARVTELRRGLDWLETRPDIDRSRIALLGMSAGGGPGVLVSALESRYRSVVFQGTGITAREKEYAPAASRINFVPRIHAPKLMLHGLYDEDTPLKSEAEPMFRLLSEPKRLLIFEGGHIPPREVAIPAISNWLDETMGKVEQ
jgi:formylglycine-generating enzyme required for sulfatase activity/dienelactone hydrolase